MGGVVGFWGGSRGVLGDRGYLIAVVLELFQLFGDFWVENPGGVEIK